MIASQPTYLFYDLETTGLNPCFDQVLQFGAIRTDLDLNEIDRHEIKVKLNPDIIPSAHAILTHRIGWQDMQQGMNEYEAIQLIHQHLNHPGTISVGYNTLGFDDEFLRFNFFRNLLPPYTHQYANYCSRMDILPITLIFYLYNQDIIKWPIQDNKVSLKLENLNKYNNFATGMSHDAIVDVEATIALARKLKTNTKMWNYLTDFFDKQTDVMRQEQLSCGLQTTTRTLPQALLTNLKFGQANGYQIPALGLGQHQHYKNQTLWLRLDDDKLQQSSITEFIDTTYVVRKKTAEAPILLPTKDRFMQKLKPERLKTMQGNIKWLNDNQDILTAIQQHYLQETYDIVENIDTDAQLYQLGFPSRQEEALFKKFHQSPHEKKWLIAQQFPNKVRIQHAMRILARNHSEHLPESYQDEFNQQRHANKKDYRSRTKYNMQQAIKDINTLENTNLDNEQAKLLSKYKQEINKLTASTNQ